MWYNHDQEVVLVLARPEIHLPSGRYLGTRNDKGTMTFMGIPYGRFAGRWKPLEPVEPGTALHDASGFGPACPQIEFGPYPAMKETVEFREETCFTLSVSTASLEGKKPVYVYIHGGANVAGGYFDPKIQTAGFVDTHPDLVAVTFNYRLGILGTLCLDGLTQDLDYRFSGNLSTLDQLMALRWVHDNIARFGGDPENVTIGGQSSGCASVKQLFFVRESWPLWKRAICQSGTTLSNSRPISLQAGRNAAWKLCEALGAHSLQDLLDMDVQRLLSVSPFAIGAGAVEDGLTLPVNMNELLCGKGADVLPRGKEILIGCMNGDMDGFAQDPASLETTRKNVAQGIGDMLRAMSQTLAEQYVDLLVPGKAGDARAAERLRTITDAQAEELIRLYEQSAPGEDPWFLLSDCLNDFLMYNPLALECSGLCGQNRVWLYVWTWAPQSVYPQRATHAMDVPFVFGARHTIPVPLTQAEQALAEQMYRRAAELWGSFIRGEPGIWEPFTPERKPTLQIGLELDMAQDPRSISGQCLAELLKG